MTGRARSKYSNSIVKTEKGRRTGDCMIMKRFGVSRVLEPKGTIPAAAWKIDNSRELGKGEIRIRLEMLHVEWDNFCQICSHCGYDDTRVKARIMQIIQQRM